MENNKRLSLAFAEALDINVEGVSDDLTYQSIPEWDSITHMILISHLEEVFNVSIETDDVIDMSSVLKAREILTKYGVKF